MRGTSPCNTRAHNCKKREEWRKEQAQLEKTGVNQYYGIRAFRGPVGLRPLCGLLALGVIGGLGYYIYRTKKGEVQPQTPDNPPKQPSQAIATQPQSNKFEMD